MIGAREEEVVPDKSKVCLTEIFSKMQDWIINCLSNLEIHFLVCLISSLLILT